MSSRSRPGGGAEQLVLVGRIRRPHGVRGELLIEVLTDVADRFAPGRTLQLAANGSLQAVEVVASRRHREALVLRLAEVTDRDAAADLRGAELLVFPEDVPPPPPDGHYYFELLGCRCRDVELGDLGEVRGVLEDGGGVLLEVFGAGGELLVPFVDGYLLRVDTDEQVIEVRLPRGFIEVCGSE